VHGKLVVGMFQDLSKPRVVRNLILETKTETETGAKYGLSAYLQEDSVILYEFDHLTF
jgi:hypothetical protein